MSNEILLTVAVPTYNGERTIKNMMDILLPQLDARVEVLVSDNCSTDSTPEIVLYYQKRYPQLKYIRNKENLGADGNFLQCMRLARGKFTMLISDDDIIIEGGIEKILEFLNHNPKVQLAYLDTVGFKNKYKSVKECHHYKRFSPDIQNSFVTNDKKKFMTYAQRMWGFTSTYVWNTERMNSVDRPEKYFGTFFLQSYMHIECANRVDDLLGVIKGPCIAVGEYGIIGNYDTAKVEGVYYRRMIDAAINSGFDKKELLNYYKWKLRHLVVRAVIKEKTVGVKKTRLKSIINATKGLPFTRCVILFSYCLPRPICRFVLVFYRRLKNVSAETYVNRPTD